MKEVVVQTVSVQANWREQVKPRSGGRKLNRLHVQKALLEYLLQGRIETN